MIFGMSYYQIAWYFMIYSFAGWLLEEIYHAVNKGIIVNRGFLNGPLCPVYGFGALSIFVMSDLIGQEGSGEQIEKIPLWLLFIGGVILATLIELIAGFLLDKLFHARWWDYSDKPFNLHGYICLEFSLIWGLIIAFAMRVIQPYIRSHSFQNKIPSRYGWFLLLLLYGSFLVDIIATVITVNHFNKQLEEVDKLTKGLRKVSDGVTEVIGKTTIQTALAMQEGRERLQEHAEDRADRALEARDRMEKRREELIKNLGKGSLFGSGRLLKAFPRMQHREFDEVIAEIRRKKREEKNVSLR